MPSENSRQSPGPEPLGEPHGQATTKPSPNGNGHSTKGLPGSAAALGLDLNVSTMALRAMNPDGYQHFMFINPVTGKNSGWIFVPGSWAEKRALIEAEQDKGNNAYCMVNEPFPPGTGGLRVDEPHPGEKDIAKIRGVPFDCDIAKSIVGATKQADAHGKIIKAFELAASGLFNSAVPGIISDSGNGAQGEFILPETVDATPEDVEKARQAGRGIQAHFRKVLGSDIADVDSVWDVCRVMRIPGTINFPTAAKIKRGRVMRASKLIAPLTGRTATLDEILAEYPAPLGAASGPAAGSASRRSGSRFDRDVAALMKQIDTEVLKALDGATYAELPEDLWKKFDEALKTDAILSGLWANGGFGDGSGSDQVYALAKSLIRGKDGAFSIMDFGQLVWVWDHAAGGKGVTAADGLGNGDRRSLARCWAKALEELPERVFADIDVENDLEIQEAEEASAGGAGGRSSHRHWKEFNRLLGELRAARDEIMVNHAGIETYGKNTPDFGTEKDEPFVTSRHARGEVSMTVAPPARGKTLLAIPTALAIVLERPEMLTGAYTRDPTEVTDWAGDVVLVLNESAGRAQAMLAAAEAVHGYTKKELQHEIHIYPSQLVLAGMGPQGVVPTEAGLEFLRWLIGKRKRGQIALVVFDTFASTISGLPENSADAVQPVMDMLDAMAKAGFCAVEVIHHVAKSGSNIDAYQGRGSGATGAAVRSMSSLARKSEDDKTRLVLSSLKASNRPDADDVEFKVVSHPRQVERARSPGNFRTASIAVLKRMTAAEVAEEDAAKKGTQAQNAVYAIDIAIKAGITIRPGGMKPKGCGTNGAAWQAAWHVVKEEHDRTRQPNEKAMTRTGALVVVDLLEKRGRLKRQPLGQGEEFTLAERALDEGAEF